MLLAAPHFVLFAEVGLRELADDEQPVGIADSVQSADGSGVDFGAQSPEVSGRACRPHYNCRGPALWL